MQFGVGRLFSLVSDAVIVASAKSGRVVRWNPAAAEMFGVDADDAVGMPIYELVPENLRDRHIEGLARYARGEPSTIIDKGAVELPALRADGSSLWIELRLSSVPPEDESGADDDRHVIAVIRDASARKVAEAKAVADADQLRSVNESLRDFLAAVAHDVVGPAGGISGAADLILDGAAESEEVAEVAGLIRRQADLVVELGRDLGQLAVIEGGTTPTHPRDLNVDAIVSDAIESVAHLGSSSLELRIPVGLAIRADATHAKRIVSNLVGNALKYGGPPIDISADRVDAGVELRVRDRGAGVPAGFASRMFDKFTRAGSGGAGLGLGLAIAKGLASANDGDLWYEPNELTGSVFTVRFPAAQSAPPP